jgi:hypothetical protein
VFSIVYQRCFNYLEMYTNNMLPKGPYVLGAVPWQTAYYTTTESFAGTNGTAQDFYMQLQIGSNLTRPASEPYRSGVTIYDVTGDTQAASGTALVNSHFGPRGAPQLFTPDFKSVVRPVYSIPFTKP